VWFATKHRCDSCNKRINELYKKQGEKFVDSASVLKACANWARNHAITDMTRPMYVTMTDVIEARLIKNCHDYLDMRNNPAPASSAHDEKQEVAPVLVAPSTQANMVPPKQLSPEEVEELRRNHQNEQISWMAHCPDHKFKYDELKAWFDAGNHTCPACHKESSSYCKEYGRKFAVMNHKYLADLRARLLQQPLPNIMNLPPQHLILGPTLAPSSTSNQPSILRDCCWNPPVLPFAQPQHQLPLRPAPYPTSYQPKKHSLPFKMPK
jgi:hypothetical protein